MVEFRLLGELEVLRDGARLDLGAHRQRALLALLLLHANAVLPTERLIAELWGESPPRTAATALHNAISQLRKLIGAELLETRAPGYVLRVAAEQLDLARFEAAVRAARAHPAPERARLLRDALTLWRGPALADLPYETFVQPEARRLDELRLAATEDRIEADLEAGNHADLVSELDALVAEHPQRERLRAQQMLALYRSGRQAHALEAYQQARRTLADELGIEPSPTLRQLHGAILRQEAGLESHVARAAGNGNGDAVADVAEVLEALLAGRVVPVLGSDSETLATQLAERFRYPRAEGLDLPRVSQYVAVMRGLGPLYDELHALHAADCEPTSLHRFFASLPPLLRDRGAPHQLLVTTACGDGLERAFAEAGEEIDVVSYIATGRARGKFSHRSPDGTMHVIDVPNTYAVELSLERRTIVLKVHGQLDATPSREWESFVVTEDDYIDYLGRADVDSALPVGLAATLRRSHFLFLGYGMHDWNLRVVLGRMWGDRPVSYRSWAVHPRPKPIERELWRRVDVDLVELSVEDYVEALSVQAGLGPVEAA